MGSLVRGDPGGWGHPFFFPWGHWRDGDSGLGELCQLLSVILSLRCWRAEGLRLQQGRGCEGGEHGGPTFIPILLS